MSFVREPGASEALTERDDPPDVLGAICEAATALMVAGVTTQPGAPAPEAIAKSVSLPEHHSIEQQLAALVARSEEWWSVYDVAMRCEADAQEADPEGSYREKLADMAAGHATRISRTFQTQATNLPATTVRELGMQAKLVAAELNEWWDDNDLQAGETACRLLLDGLMGLAGVVRIARPDLNIDEARDWLQHPEAHVSKYFIEAREARS